jgi:hypothetical protein
MGVVMTEAQKRYSSMAGGRSVGGCGGESRRWVNLASQSRDGALLLESSEFMRMGAWTSGS